MKFLRMNPKNSKSMFFSVAVDFELLKDSLEEAEQFAMDYIDCEEKEYCRMIDEFNKN